MQTSLVYLSEAPSPLDEEALFHLAKQAALKNQQLGITGYLNYRQGVFFQYLEGEEDQLEAVMQTIQNDPRHRVLKVLWLGPQPERRFPNWAMRYLTKKDLKQLSVEDMLEETLATLSSSSYQLPESRIMVIRLLDLIASRNRGPLH